MKITMYMSEGDSGTLYSVARHHWSLTLRAKPRRPSSMANEDLSTRRFIEENEGRLVKIHGYVGFNYAAHIRGQSCTHGEWPLLCLMRPREQSTPAITDLLDSKSTFASQSPITIDSEKGTVKYSSLVAKAVAEIKSGKYTKIIISRAVDLTDELDMPATLLRGRRGNNPARSFSFNHERFQATGFSPELVLSLDKGKS
ncbi:hypothetical protein ACEPPN_009398 [Leptodophora sp. 'Broadleaf-Isolate-01']